MNKVFSKLSGVDVESGNSELPREFRRKARMTSGYGFGLTTVNLVRFEVAAKISYDFGRPK